MSDDKATAEGHTVDEQIAAAAKRAGLELARVARVNGRASAVFMVWPNPSYGKTFATSWYNDESELLRAVLDTLENTDIGGLDVNIFSSAMFEFLSAEMLPNDGRTVSLTIKGVAEEKITGPRGESVKVIVSFNERPKRLILNKTNALALARVLGPETDAWRGAVVVLCVENIKVGRDIVPSIRVKSAVSGRPPNADVAPVNTIGDDPALRHAPGAYEGGMI